MDSKGDTHFLVRFFCVGYFRSLYFQERHEERKRRFRSLIFIYAVGMKSIFASARCGIVKRYPQIVLAQEPTKDAMGFLSPALVVRQPRIRVAETLLEPMPGLGVTAKWGFKLSRFSMRGAPADQSKLSLDWSA